MIGPIIALEAELRGIERRNYYVGCLHRYRASSKLPSHGHLIIGVQRAGLPFYEFSKELGEKRKAADLFILSSTN